LSSGQTSSKTTTTTYSRRPEPSLFVLPTLCKASIKYHILVFDERILLCRSLPWLWHTAIGCTAKWNLIHNSCTIHQPSDSSHIRPCKRWIVEYTRILSSTIMKLFIQLVTTYSECFTSAIQI
jgi:hypothetical protein